MTLTIRTTALIATALALTSCVETVDCDVLRLNRLPPPHGETISVSATDTTGSRSLEFAAYRDLIHRELGALGYTPVRQRNADLQAQVTYSVGAADTRRDYYWPSCSYHYHFQEGQALWPQWRRYDCQNEPLVSEVPQYLRELRVDIVRSDDTAGNRLFEGRVRSVGSEDRLDKVMPYLVTAMFKNFPSESGKWKTVTISREEVEAPRSTAPAPPMSGPAEACDAAT